MRHLFLFSVLALLLATGCEARKEPTLPPAYPPPPAREVPSGSLLRSPTDPTVVELPTEALPLWRASQERRPALVLLSFDPFLAPIPGELREKALALARTGSPKEIAAHGSIHRPAPLILPTQAVGAALEAGFFSRLYWVFPSKVKPQDLKIAIFRDQMTKSHFLTPEEAAALTLKDGVYSGTVRGIPFVALHPDRLATVQEPFLLHVDLSWFRGLYDNEVKTPLYDLLHETALSLRKTGLNPLSVSLSYSVLEGQISMDTRFLLRNLAEIFRRPDLLDGEMPPTWRRRAEALYAAEMYTDSKKISLFKDNAAEGSGDPTVVYDLFQGHFLARELDPALSALDQAVALDRGYAAAYLDLAQMAVNDRNPAAALKLLDKAAAAFPDNPFVDLQRADLLLQTGERGRALAILLRLKGLPWSKVHHPDVPPLLARMEKEARGAQAALPQEKGR